jgi:hypothetical protein
MGLRPVGLGTIEVDTILTASRTTHLIVGARLDWTSFRQFPFSL